MEVSVVLKDKIELWFVIEYDIIFILIGILNPYLFIYITNIYLGSDRSF